MIVVSDTCPISYLALIGHVSELADLYGHVLVPAAVADEFLNPNSPMAVRELMTSPPEWLEVVQVSLTEQRRTRKRLARGELEAIALAEQRHAELLLCDDRDARIEAEQRGLRVVGTLRVLVEAHANGLLDGPAALARLQATNFRATPELFSEVLATMRI